MGTYLRVLASGGSGLQMTVPNNLEWWDEFLRARRCKLDRLDPVVSRAVSFTDDMVLTDGHISMPMFIYEIPNSPLSLSLSVKISIGFPIDVVLRDWIPGFS